MGRRELERNLRLGKLFRRLGLGLSFSLVLPFGLLPRRSDGRAGARGRLEHREQRTHRRLREHRPVSLLRVQLRDFLVGPERPAHQLHRVDTAPSRRSGSRRRRRRGGGEGEARVPHDSRFLPPEMRAEVRTVPRRRLSRSYPCARASSPRRRPRGGEEAPPGHSEAQLCVRHPPPAPSSRRRPSSPCPASGVSPRVPPRTPRGASRDTP